MVHFEQYFFIVCFFAFYSAQNCLSTHTPLVESCIEEIHKVFDVPRHIKSPNPLKRHRNPVRKVFAKAAYLNLRIPKESNLFAESTFIDKENNKMYENAEAYYKHILEPGHLIESTLLKRPMDFCEQRKKERPKRKKTQSIAPGTNTKKISAKRKKTILTAPGTNTTITACTGQLALYGISWIDNDGLKSIKSIYENVLIKEVDPEDVYALKFIRDNVTGFLAVPPMLLPDGFCMERHLKFSERMETTYKPHDTST